MWIFLLKSRNVILLPALLIFCLPCQSKQKADDRLIFDDYIRHIHQYGFCAMTDIVIETARFFLDKPYVVSTLEKEPEQLIVNLREFDCTTFVETVLALSYTVKKSESPVFEDFCELLRQIRYRSGHINDYTDRLHYFTDWIYENEKNGFVYDVTKKAGGKPYSLELDFISSHPDRYPQLKSNSEFTEILRRKEREISARSGYSMIAGSEIAAGKDVLQNGDIVCFVTDIKGLDVTHVGFVYRYAGQMTFVHASSSAKKVIINPQSVREYVEQSRHTKGIMVVRPLDREWNFSKNVFSIQKHVVYLCSVSMLLSNCG
jgi:cell wall-associated NlpC family hydrolase